MARLGDYEDETIVYDAHLSELRWESQAIMNCNGGGGTRGQEDSNCFRKEPASTYSVGSCYLRTPTLSSDEHGTPTVDSEWDSSGSSPVEILREHGFRSSRITHDDEDRRHDSGEGASRTNPQKSIRVTPFPKPPSDGESAENLTSHPISSMNHVTKLTKRPSLTLSMNQFSGHSSCSNSPVSIRVASAQSSGSPCKQPTLRRTDGMNTFRRSAPMPETEEPLLFGTSQVAPRPQSQPALSSSPSSFSLKHKRNSSSTSIPITSFQTHSRSYSQPNTVRLGHPNRPYYSAIRKDMSPPSPDAVKSAHSYSRPASPPSSYPFRNHARMSPQGLRSARDREDAVSELSLSPLPLPFGYGSGNSTVSSSAGAGASVSVGTESSQSTSISTNGKCKERHRSAPALSRKEEMELRLALARNVRGPLGDPDVGRQPGATDSLKRKVDKLRKGFRDMWRRRS